MVRHGDNQWSDIVRWTLHVLIAAEELAIKQATVDQHLQSKNPGVARLLGKTGNLGKMLGLRPKWAYQIIKQVGAYDEIFERNLGKTTPLKISRGLNSLWNQGGLHYASPFR